MIILDTTVLVYAVGSEHPLLGPCRRIVEAIESGRVRATTTAEVIQEFAHVRARRRARRDARRLAAAWITLLSPLLSIERNDLERGLGLFEERPGIGCFDAVLAAACLERGVDALVSADAALAVVTELRVLSPASPEVARMVGA